MSKNYFRLEAPYPALSSTVLLPSPEIGNNMGLLSSVQVLRMRDGSTRSYIKRGDNKKRHRYDFLLSRDKMEELAGFVSRYKSATYRVVWRDRTIIGKLSINPVEYGGRGRAGGWPGGEAYEVTIEITEV